MNMSTLLKGATILALSSTTAMAGGLDRSGQPTSIIFEDGQYLQFSAATVRPNVSGTFTANATGAAVGTSGNGQSDYGFFGMGYRGETKDGSIGYAIIYDEPYGSDVSYGAGTGAGAALNGLGGEVSTQALTFLGQYNFGNGFSAHGGIRAQQGDATAALPTALVSARTGGTVNTPYSVSGSASTAYGGVLGAAYERPEIALRVAATYSTAIDHDVNFVETVGGATTVRAGSLEFPESLNLEFQSGINQSTLVFGSVRWANYSDFRIAPPTFTGAAGGPLVSFTDDAMAYSLGVARRINENFAVSVSLGYEAGTDTASPSYFSPADGRSSIALAGIFNAGSAEITAGVRYTDLGDENVALGNTITGNFTDNEAISIGVQIGFQL